MYSYGFQFLNQAQSPSSLPHSEIKGSATFGHGYTSEYESGHMMSARGTFGGASFGGASFGGASFGGKQEISNHPSNPVIPGVMNNLPGETQLLGEKTGCGDFTAANMPGFGPVVGGKSHILHLLKPHQHGSGIGALIAELALPLISNLVGGLFKPKGEGIVSELKKRGGGMEEHAEKIVNILEKDPEAGIEAIHTVSPELFEEMIETLHEMLYKLDQMEMNNFIQQHQGKGIANAMAHLSSLHNKKGTKSSKHGTGFFDIPVIGPLLKGVASIFGIQ